MKKILLSLFLVLIVTVSAVFGLSAAAAESDFNVDITGDTLVSAGGVYTYNIKVNGIKQANGFISFTIDLKYDSDVFEFDSISAKDVTGWSMLSVTSNAGKIRICPATSDSIAGNEAEYAIKNDNVINYTFKLKAKTTAKSETSLTIEKIVAGGTDYEQYDGSGSNLSVKIRQPLATPTIVSFEEGLAKWNPVDNAKSYSVQIYKGNDEYKSISTSATEYDFSSDLTDGGKYYFTVTAVSDKPEYMDSEESQRSSAYSVRGTLVSPSITLTSNYKNGGLTYQITDTNPQGTVSKYTVELYEKDSNTLIKEIESNTLSGQITTQDHGIVVGKEYEVCVTAVSSDTETNNDSLSSAHSEPALAVSKVKEITVKTQPKLKYFEGEKLSFSDMVVTIVFVDQTTKDISFADFDNLDITTSIENGKTLSLNDNRKVITVSFIGAFQAETSALEVSTTTCSHKTTHNDECAPTCGTDGYTKVVCDSCGMALSETVIPATGEHQFGDWVILHQPTAELNGVQIRTCSVCNHKEQESIPKTGPITSDDSDDSSETTELETDPPVESDDETEPINTEDGMNDLSRVFLIVVIVIFSLILVFIIGAVWLENRKSRVRRSNNNRNMNNRGRR